MAMIKYSKLIAFITVICISCSQNFEWVSTSESQSWVTEKGVKLSLINAEYDVLIDTSLTLQTIEGFGACFNELGWTALNRLSEEDRASVFEEFFKPGAGAGFTICRMPVGANDFSRDWYSYDETEGDFEMKNFSIENDLETLVPFIQEALKKNPDLKIWASPWSPPAWMKWNKHYACRIPWEGLDPKFDNHLPADRQGKEGTDMFIQEDAYFRAYALYFSKFIQAYRKQGIDVSMIMPQNEFNSCQIFPSCTWTVAGLARFIGDYLGPAMEEEGVDIMFGTMERPTVAFLDTILNHPQAGGFIKGAGFQWAGKEAIAGVHEKYPALKLYQTEQECGDGKNDWEYCLYAWSLMKHYFKQGVSAYMYWNIALDEGGYSRWGWQQNSLITIDTLSNSFHYNPEYYLMKHLSHFVKPGARMLQTKGAYQDALAFQNPDRSVVLVLFSEKGKQYRIKLGEQMLVPQLKKGSFNTFVIRP
jgi:glucosylceramidase